MSRSRFLTYINGLQSWVEAIASSIGAGDANKIVRTHDNGRLHQSLMPVGVGVNVTLATASEALNAGDWVNLYVNGATKSVRKADASNNRPANGFVLDVVANAAQATVFEQGENTALNGLDAQIGQSMRLSATTPGVGTFASPALTNGHIIQSLGFVTSATSVLFEYDDPTYIAA